MKINSYNKGFIFFLLAFVCLLFPTVFPFLNLQQNANINLLYYLGFSFIGIGTIFFRYGKKK